MKATSHQVRHTRRQITQDTTEGTLWNGTGGLEVRSLGVIIHRYGFIKSKWTGKKPLLFLLTFPAKVIASMTNRTSWGKLR